MQRWRLTSLTLILLLALLSVIYLPARGQANVAKIDPHLLQTLETASEAEWLIVLSEQAAITAVNAPAGSRAAQSIASTLQTHATTTQAPLTRFLDAELAEYRSYWIANAIWVRGDAALLQTLAQRDDVAQLVANPWIEMGLPEPAGEQIETALGGVEWGVSQIGATTAWANNITGAGLVVGGADTGIEWDHPGIIQQYRGWNGSSANHNYNWHDAVHEENPNNGGVNPCGLSIVAPCDDNGHGTHTIGTMVGNDLDPAAAGWPAAASNAVGVAPGAQWVGCRNMEQGWGQPSTYIECFEWFVAPTDSNGNSPNPALAPDVINNSWSCPGSEGCNTSAVELMETVVNNVRAAGIVVVASAGNTGPSCGSITRPPAFFEASYTVGATNNSDAIAGFSSRGPDFWNNDLKPDISAPGQSVRSTVPGGGYSIFSGTSMAGPHVAGAIALLLDGTPELRGQVDLIEATLNTSALPRTTSEGCGGLPADAVPNHTFGHGRLDIWAALNVTWENGYLPAVPQQ